MLLGRRAGGLSASHVADSGLCDKVVIAFKQETSGHIHDTQVNTHKHTLANAHVLYILINCK